MTKKLTNEEFIKKISAINSNVVPLEEYKGGHTKIKVTYKTCGHIEYKEPVKLYSGQGCGNVECKRSKLSNSKIKKVEIANVKKLDNLGIKLLEPYKGTKVKTKVLNTKCQHEYKVSLANVINGSGCPICHGMKDTKTFVKVINEKYPNQYTVTGEYINNRTPIEVIHNECGHRWKVIPKDLLRDEKCPNCIISKGERYIQRYLKSHNIKLEPQYKFEDCKNINALPFDFAIFINGKIGLIEFDGSQHFRNSSGLWGSKRNSFEGIHARDEIKNKYCDDNKIPLLRIPYWWIRNDKAEKELQKFIFNL